MRPPGACPHGTDLHMWQVTPRFLPSVNLPEEPKCPSHRSPHQSNCWQGHSCQPGAMSGPPNRNYGRVFPQPPERMEELNLHGLEEWPEVEQEQARELLLKWEHLFTHSDLNLGKTSLIKHWIELTDQIPFRECYQCIPSHMYDDMKAHLQETLDIDAIQKSHSPWASRVVLVWKKDVSLRFCIDLRKLNNWTIKDTYALPHIDETLDSLQGSQWFSSLDLKYGYWQVEMDEESKPLTAFTIGLLGL